MQDVATAANHFSTDSTWLVISGREKFGYSCDSLPRNVKGILRSVTLTVLPLDPT